MMSDTEYKANRPSARRSLSASGPGNVAGAPSAPSGKSSSNVAHSGFSFFGGNSDFQGVVALDYQLSQVLVKSHHQVRRLTG